MKKLILILLTALALPVMAQHRHHGHHAHGGHGWGWVAPALISGAVVYAATRPAPQPSVVYVPAPQTQVLPPAPMGFRYEQILDANCNCYRWVLVQG